MVRLLDQGLAVAAPKAMATVWPSGLRCLQTLGRAHSAFYRAGQVTSSAVGPLMAPSRRSANRVARSGSSRAADVPYERVESSLMTQSGHPVFP
jgi:hypothetical protein